MAVDQSFANRVERFLCETGMDAIRFGRAATRNPRFILDLRDGRTPGAVTRKNVEHFMNTYRKTGAAA